MSFYVEVSHFNLLPKRTQGMAGLRGQRARERPKIQVSQTMSWLYHRANPPYGSARLSSPWKEHWVAVGDESPSGHHAPESRTHLPTTPDALLSNLNSTWLLGWAQEGEDAGFNPCQGPLAATPGPSYLLADRSHTAPLSQSQLCPETMLPFRLFSARDSGFIN